MSRRVHRAALAVTLDGTMLVSLAQFERTRMSPEALPRAALEQSGAFFIGVALTSREAEQTLRRINNAAAEAAGFVVARRQRRRRGTARNRRKTAS